MHRASDRQAEAETLDTLERHADVLDLDDDARSIAADLYLATLPVPDRSKPVTLAASCYTAALITNDERSQSRVADVFGVSRLAIQQRWKPMLEESGFTAPDW